MPTISRSGVASGSCNESTGWATGVRRTLAPAAVIGRSFDVVSLADVVDASPLETITDLDAATARWAAGRRRITPASSDSCTRSSSRHLEESLSATPPRPAACGGRPSTRGDTATISTTSSRPCTTGSQPIGSATRCTPATSRPRSPRGRPNDSPTNVRSASSIGRSRCWRWSQPARSRPRRGAPARRPRTSRLRRVPQRRGDRAALPGRRSGRVRRTNPATLAEAALVASLNRRHGLDDPELLGLLERASERCPPEPAVLPAMLHIRRSRLLPAAIRHEQRSRDGAARPGRPRPDGRRRPGDRRDRGRPGLLGAR